MVNDARFVGAVRRLAALQPDFEYVAPVGGSDQLDAERVLTGLGYGWRTAAWANEAQACQDAGDHWRDAVRKADGLVRENGGPV